MTRKPLRLGDDLEKAVLYAIVAGRCQQDVVRPEECSKLGRAVLVAIHSLAKPTFPNLLLHITEVQGISKDAAAAYIDAVQRIGSEVDAGEILQKVRDKQILVEVINAATDQLARSLPDLGAFPALLADRIDTRHGLSSVAERVKDGLPEPPKGLAIRSLPMLAESAGGLIGVWAISGEPGVGKSTLAWQLALDIGRNVPVLYYDFENGFAVMMDHTREIYKGDLERIRRATSSIYYRDSIRSLDSDLGSVVPPALVVVDSIQKLPASAEYRRSSLDRWIHRLEGLKKRGYFVLLVSEVSRAHYESDAYIGAFKETGEIEYSADFGVQLIPLSDEIVEATVVKNRHRPKRGVVATLQRRGWRWEEMNQTKPTEVD